MQIDEPVSIILPVYNGEKYLKQQIESIIIELNENDELIISDDCSSDGSESIIKQFNDSRLVFYKQKNNIGLNKNIQFLAEKCSYEMIILSDQDDVWKKGRLKIFRDSLKDNELVIDDCIVVDSNLNIIYNSYRSVIPFSSSLWGNIYRCSFLGCCMGVKKSLLKQAFPLPRKMVGHDLCIGLTAILNDSKIKIISHGMLLYRRHSESMSSAATSNSKRWHNLNFSSFLRRVIAVLYILQQYFRLEKK